MKDTMQAIVANGYGDPSVFEWKEVAMPQPKNDEVLIKVHTSSATTADGMMRTGKPYVGRLVTGLRAPKNPIPGTGFAGVVVAKGEDVGVFEIGDRVFGETTLGFSTNAEYVAVPAHGVILRMPENMKFEEAANFCDGHLTSLNFLQEIAKLTKDQKLLIVGASGSLGTAAVQLAKYIGAEVTAVCSERNAGLVRSLGADFVVDYQKVDFTQSGKIYDVVFDTLGVSDFSKCKNVLTSDGQYICPVLGGKLLMQSLVSGFAGKQRAKFAATGMKSDQELRMLLVQLTNIFREGKLKTVIDRQFPLAHLAQAHEYIATGRKKGNVVINHMI